MKKTILKISLLTFFVSFNLVTAQGVERDGVKIRATTNLRAEEGQRLTQEVREEAKNSVEAVSGGVSERAKQLRKRVTKRIQLNPSQNQEQLNQRIEKARQRLGEKKTELLARREQMLQNKNARKVTLTAKRRIRVQGLVDNMLTRFISTTEKLGRIVERLKIKIDAMDQNGKAVEDAKLSLEASIERIENLITEIEAVRAELDASIDGEISPEYMRDVVSNIRVGIRNTHESLKLVITEISN